MYLSLPIPHSPGGKVPLQACLNALVNKELMAGSEAWYVFHVDFSLKFVLKSNVPGTVLTARAYAKRPNSYPSPGFHLFS